MDIPRFMKGFGWEGKKNNIASSLGLVTHFSVSHLRKIDDALSERENRLSGDKK